MLPPDCLERAAGVCHVNGLVPDVTVITRAVSPQHIEDFGPAITSGERGGGTFGPLLVPLFQGGCQFRRGLRGWGNSAVHRTHGVVAVCSARVTLLGSLEVVEHVEQRQQAR